MRVASRSRNPASSARRGWSLSSQLLCRGKFYAAVLLSLENNPSCSVRRAFDTILATGLVHHFPPKHHNRARPILDRILFDHPDDVPCLLGRAYVLQHARRWEEATATFNHVAKLTANNVDDDVNLEAEEEAGWCMLNDGQRDNAEQRLKDVLARLSEREGYEDQKARASWRLGRCLWESGGKTPSVRIEWV